MHGDEGDRPDVIRVVSENVLTAMREGGVENAFIVLRDGKWDVPSYLGDGNDVGLNLAYVMMRRPHGTPFTLDDAYPFVKGKTVVMGFPDVLVEPISVFKTLLERERDTGADLVLGLFPARRPNKVDMVDLGADGRPKNIYIKPSTTSLTYTWVSAVWAPSFTEYLHDHVASAEHTWDHRSQEMYVGHVFQAALDDGLSVGAACFPDGRCTDIGTPKALREVLRDEYSESSE